MGGQRRGRKGKKGERKGGECEGKGKEGKEDPMNVSWLRA